MLPMVYSYLHEDKRGRLEYIHSMNLRALEEVMQVEDDEDLWLAAENAKRAILVQYELERDLGSADGLHSEARKALVRTLILAPLSTNELLSSMMLQNFDGPTAQSALENSLLAGLVVEDQERHRWSLTAAGRRFRWGKG